MHLASYLFKIASLQACQSTEREETNIFSQHTCNMAKNANWQEAEQLAIYKA